MTDQQPEALRLADMYDYGDPLAHGNAWKSSVCTELRRLHAENEALKREIAATQPVAQGMTEAACSVLAERARQISSEGWTPERDDGYVGGELSTAAGCYAMQAYGGKQLPHLWPWADSWWKPSESPRRNLEKAGALILAEIERMDRSFAAQAKQEEK